LAKPPERRWSIAGIENGVTGIFQDQAKSLAYGFIIIYD
jgi:hypothetical protein